MLSSKGNFFNSIFYAMKKRNSKRLERIADLTTVTENLSKAFHHQKISFSFTMSFLNDNNEIEIIKIDTVDFFQKIPGNVFDDIIRNLFVVAQIEKINEERLIK